MASPSALFSFRRRRDDDDLKHIAPGLVPSASIAPKPAVPRTPPPRTPDASPERPRDRWCQGSRPRLPSPGSSEEEELQYEDQEEEEEREVLSDEEQHLYQTVDGQLAQPITEPVYAPPLQVTEDKDEEDSNRWEPHALSEPGGVAKRQEGVAMQPTSSQLTQKSHPDSSCVPQDVTMGTSSPSLKAGGGTCRKKAPPRRSSELRPPLREPRGHAPRDLPPRPCPLAPTGVQEQQVQNLKRTIQRLSVELSHYQAHYRPPDRDQVDVTHLSPLLLAYEDRMAEKDSLLQAVQEEVMSLCVRVEEVVTENQTLHERLGASGAVSQHAWCALQQQAALVLKENQVLLDRLQAQEDRVSRLTRRVVQVEEERRGLQEKKEETEAELRALRSRVQEAVTWEEHCDITGKLHRQLEQEQARREQEVEEVHLKAFRLEEEKRVLQEQNSLLTRDSRSKEQARRKVCARLQQSVQQEQESDLLLSSLLTLVQRSTVERDQLALLASALQQEKEGGVCAVLDGTLRLRKLHDKIKVYRERAWAGRARADQRQQEREAELATSHREQLRLQQQLGNTQKLLDASMHSKQLLEEELGVVWEVATRENQGMRESLWNGSPSRGVQTRAVLGRASPPAEPAEHAHGHAYGHAHGHALGHAHIHSDETEKQRLDFYS